MLCNLALKLAGLPLSPTLHCTQHFIPCILVDKAVLPPHSGDHRRTASYRTTARDCAPHLLFTPTIVTSIAFATQQILQLTYHCSRKGCNRVQLSSEDRSFAVRCTTSNWLLARLHDSQDAVPRFRAINHPITRSSSNRPVRATCNNSVISSQDYQSVQFAAGSSTSSVSRYWCNLRSLQRCTNCYTTISL